MPFKKNIFFYLIISITLFSSCDKNEDILDDDIIVKNEDSFSLDRTILVYMNADNSLSSFTGDDINDMKTALAENPSNLNLLVYEDKDSQSYLWRIYLNDKGEIQQTVIRPYKDKNASDPEWMTSVISEAFAMFPAEEKGLVLWSHGTAWLPASNYQTSTNATFINTDFLNTKSVEQSFISFSPLKTSVSDISDSKSITVNPSEDAFSIISVEDNQEEFSFSNDDSRLSDVPVQFSFGDDKRREMNIWELRESLENTGLYFDFIAFDACFMASVEVAYELRNLTGDIMASVTEILGEGYPYLSIVALWTKPELSVENMCKAYFDFYSNNGSKSYGSISHIKTSELENIAEKYSSIIKNSSSLNNVYIDSIQSYGRIRTGFGNLFFDMAEVIKYKDFMSFESFNDALLEAIPYKNSTPYFVEKKINLDAYSGISVFIPELSSRLIYHDAYKNLQWYKKVYLD